MHSLVLAGGEEASIESSISDSVSAATYGLHDSGACFACSSLQHPLSRVSKSRRHGVIHALKRVLHT